MKRNPEHGKKLRPSYQELENTCRILQEQVAHSVKLHQDLINAKNELDEELNRFRLIQRYGSNALRAGEISAFLTLTVEYFAEAFEQPRVVFFEYTPGRKALRRLEQLGYEPDQLPESLAIDASLFKDGECRLLHANPELHRQFACLDMLEAMICPFFDSKQQQLGGLIVSGFTRRESAFMEPVKESDRASYAIMTQNAGLFLQNLRVLDRLQREILERRQIERALLVYQQELEDHKQALEARVAQRTRDLAASNRQLQQEIEERALIEQELRRSNAELEEFAYIASHDLKAPLRSVISFSQLLEKRHGQQFDEEARSFMQFIKQGVRRFEEVIDDLLHYSRVFRTSAGPAPIDFNSLIDGVLARLRGVIDKTNAHVEVAPLPTLKVRQYEFEQLFQNLLDNALKFGRPGEHPVIRIGARMEKEAYLFWVSDQGIGIDSRFQEKIFGLFQRLHTDAQYEGSGIGLAICKKVVSRHGGKIWFESDGKGTTFYFSLPRQLGLL